MSQLLLAVLEQGKPSTPVRPLVLLHLPQPTVCTKPQGGKSVLSSFYQELTPMQNQRANTLNSAKQDNSASFPAKKNPPFTSQRKRICSSQENSPIHRDVCFLTVLFEASVPKRQKSHYPSFSFLAWKSFKIFPLEVRFMNFWTYV